MSAKDRYADDQIEAIWRAMRERRDMRHFSSEPLPDGLIRRLVEAAPHAPTGGDKQPGRGRKLWKGRHPGAIYELVAREQELTAAALGSRNQEFLKVKVEGIRECAELLVVVLMPERAAHVIGRRTMPDMDLASVGCAIQNMWLAARAEGVGIGWVSFFEPEALAQLLRLPASARAVSILCIGQVEAFYPRPMFETTGWGRRLELEKVLFENEWPEGAGGTPSAY